MESKAILAIPKIKKNAVGSTRSTPILKRGKSEGEDEN